MGLPYAFLFGAEFPAGAVSELKLKKADLFICRRDVLTDKIGVTLARRHQLRVI